MLRDTERKVLHLILIVISAEKENRYKSILISNESCLWQSAILKHIN